MKNTLNNTTTLLSHKEAAKYIGVEESTLAVWFCPKRYNLPYVKVRPTAKIYSCRTSEIYHCKDYYRQTTKSIIATSNLCNTQMKNIIQQISSEITHINYYMHIDCHRNHNKLLTRQQAADFLGVSKGTLEVWASTKRYALKFFKIGRLVKYRMSDLLDFIDARVQSSFKSNENYK